ncbi:hypothetical protein QE152_g567 [Popillia japonica]|uniref:Uncharacterized protein n=1 Tax=Popillia japonica TaxID=7064 RepID=A0AAW1NK11_POPJA
MAIPFTIPAQEVSQTNIQDLLRELCEILQQLVIICRQQSINQSAPRNRASTNANQDPMPDIMTSLTLLSAAFTTAQNMPIRTLRRPRRYRLSSESSCEDGKNSANGQIRSEWMGVEVDIRKLPEEFKSTFNKDDDSEEGDTTTPQSSSKSSSPSSPKRNSIFSKFVPAPFTGSICTAVICVVGWHLLRNR